MTTSPLFETLSWSLGYDPLMDLDRNGRVSKLDIVARTCMEYDPVIRGISPRTLKLNVYIRDHLIRLEMEHKVWKSVADFVKNVNAYYIHEVGYEDILRTVINVGFDPEAKTVMLHTD